jgi:SpoIID/LytB domain protein
MKRGVQPRRHRLVVLAAVAATSLGVGLLSAVPTGKRAAAETIPATSSGTWTVQGHGFGHGHGLSQYGARGAARRGQSAAQIIAFYYPGTALTQLSAPAIRVRITDDAGSTTVGVPSGQTITLSWAGGRMAITSATASKVRLVASAGHLQAQHFKTSWVNWGGALPLAADFSSSAGVLRLYQSSGSTDLRGTVGGLISSGTRMTINRLPLDSYVQGVVPREMPAQWEPAAVQAQAIAARSYARYAVEHNASSPYDICDSTSCQVYGGKTHYDAAGNPVYGEVSESNAAVTATANEVATYAGATIFAQFSASNGGWLVDGGQPYLVAKADPYEQYADDPYLNWTQTVSIASVAASYGLRKLTQISITSRDGHGQWGGRVLSATVTGVNSAGASVTQQTDGFTLTDAMGLRHPWWHVSSIVATAPTSVSAVGKDGAAQISWAPPADSGSDSISSYTISVAGVQNVSVGAGVRTTWIGGLRNGVNYTATVRAVSSAGAGAVASVTVRPVAAPVTVTALNPARLFDSRAGKVATTPANPLIFGVGGHGSIPSSAAVTAVQLAVTIVNPSADGSLRVYTDGSARPQSAAIAYRAHQTSTTSVSVPLVTSGRVVFAPSAGSMFLVADQLSYSSAGSSTIRATAPALIADMATVGTGDGRAINVRGTVPAAATAVLLQLTAKGNVSAGWLKAWPGGTANPTVSQLSVPAGMRMTNTVLVPIGADGTVRLAASDLRIGGQASIVGYLAPSGGGLLETAPITGAADSIAKVGSDVLAGTVPKVITLAGGSQIPSSGATAALLQVTVSHAGGTGVLRVYADGTAPPRAISASMVKGWTTTATLFVPLSSAGKIQVASDRYGASVAIDVLGYIAG